MKIAVQSYVAQGEPIPGRADGAIVAVIIAPEDICDINPGFTLEQARQYLAQYGNKVTDALLSDGNWCEAIRGILPTPEEFAQEHAN